MLQISQFHVKLKPIIQLKKYMRWTGFITETPLECILYIFTVVMKIIQLKILPQKYITVCKIYVTLRKHYFEFSATNVTIWFVFSPCLKILS